MHNRYILKTKNPTYLYVSLTNIDESFKTELHSHENLEILLIISGNGKIITSEKSINVKKNDLIILNSNSYHYETGNNLTFYALGINKLNYLDKNDFSKKIFIKHLNEKAYTNIYLFYDNIYKESEQNKQDCNEIIENFINLIILSIKRETDLIYNEKDDNDNEVISKIKAIIDNNYYNNIKLDDIASSLSLSKSKICHDFKHHVGKTIIEYKIDKQLIEAKNMLEISDMPINLICDMLGFNSPSYFIKLYKNKYGIKPTETRKGK